MRPVHPLARSPRSAPAPSHRWLGALALATLLALTGCSAFSRAVKEGDTASQQQKWAEAEAAYLRALAADPEASEVKVKLTKVRQSWSDVVLEEARGLHANGDLDGAMKRLVRALELNADNAPARELLTQTLDARVVVGQTALKEERLKEARAEFDAVLLEADPFREPVFTRHLAFLEESEDHQALAELMLRRAQRQEAADAAESYLSAARAFRAAGARERALLCEDQAFDLSPASEEAFE
ncbi:TetR family transcriptional regulator, partial [Pyxidicoccus sp. 3LG]